MFLPIFLPPDGQGAQRNRSSLMPILFFIIFFVMPLFRHDPNSEQAARDRIADPEIVGFSSSSGEGATAPGGSNRYIVTLFPVLDGRSNKRTSFSVFAKPGERHKYEIVPGQVETAVATALRSSLNNRQRDDIALKCTTMHSCGFLEGYILGQEIVTLASAVSDLARRRFGQDGLERAREYAKAQESFIRALVLQYRESTAERDKEGLVEYLDLVYEYYEGIISGAQESHRGVSVLTMADLFVLNSFSSGELMTIAASTVPVARRREAFSKLADPDSTTRTDRMRSLFEQTFNLGMIGDTLHILKARNEDSSIRTSWFQTRWLPKTLHENRILKITTLDIPRLGRKKVTINSIGFPGVFSSLSSFTSVRSNGALGYSDFLVSFQNPAIFDGEALEALGAPADPTGETASPLMLFFKIAVANLAAKSSVHWSDIVYSMAGPSLSIPTKLPAATTPGQLESTLWWQQDQTDVTNDNGNFLTTAHPATAPLQILVANIDPTFSHLWILIEMMPGAASIRDTTRQVQVDGHEILGTVFHSDLLRTKSGLSRLREIAPAELFLHDRDFVHRTLSTEISRENTDATLLMRRAFRDYEIQHVLDQLKEQGFEFRRVEDRVDIKT